MTTGYARIRVRPVAVRWLAAAAILASACVAGVFVVRWGIAETVVEAANRGPVTVELVDTARRLQPTNPDTAYLAGLIALDSAQPPDVETSGRLLERAVELAPSRPAYWMALGRQREIAGRPDESERCFQRAVEAAPSHWKPRWMLANLYLRMNRIAEAIEPMRVACRLNPGMAPLVARTIWNATGRGDVAALDAVTSESVAGRSAVVGLWVAEGRLDEARARWNELFDEAGLEQPVIDNGRQLADAMRAAGRGGDYADISSKLNPERGAALDTIANSGFDEPIRESETSPFAWKAVRSAEARISVDAGRTGGKALRIDYDSKGGTNFQHASQTMRVAPGAQYVLSFWTIAEKLQSGGPPAVVVADASDGPGALGAAVVPSSATAWTQLSVRFTGPPSGLVTISIARETCGPVCPIFGTVRFDDLTLTR